MFSAEQYQLLDFGRGRRLERFGEYLLDRPYPAAEKIPPAKAEAWAAADARYEETAPEQGKWRFHSPLPRRWTVSHGELRFELKCTPRGQVGLFPEQAENWDWLGKNAEWGMRNGESFPRSETGVSERVPVKVLNLFAYTGGSTLAAAAAGAEVTHVDAARNLVGWARRNAELSGLADRPIRWICEDAQKFVKRELRRGSFYDAVILDPPSYGHGPHGEVWRLSKHLPRLMELFSPLTAGRCRFVLLTCHTPGYGPEQLPELFHKHFTDASRGSLEAKPLLLRSRAGRDLPSGAVVRWLRNA